jgi:hypothetical protein
MATMAADRGGRPDGIGVEAAARSQTDEDLSPASLQALVHLHRIVEKASKTNKGTAPSVGNRPSRALTCSAASALVFLVGGTRSTSTGAVQLSRANPSRAIH